MTATTLALTTVLTFAATVKATTKAFPGLRDYGHRLVLKKWHSEAEWQAFDTIIVRESSWNPCSYNPSRSDCRYQGTNSCGIPQANPCPAEWRGRMWEARWEQVRWAVRYVASRYGTPTLALAYWNRNGSY